MKKKKKIEVFDVVNGIILGLLVVIFLIPFWIIFTASLSENSKLVSQGVSIWFRGFSIEGYKYLFKISDVFLNSLGVSVLVSVGAAILSMAVGMLAAYALSRPYMVGRKVLNTIFVMSMFFNGGMIPTVLVVRGIGLYNTIWAHILPGTISVYQILLIRNYLASLPRSLDEAAALDGANDLQMLWHIFLPLSLPMIFTIGLMTFVGKWNAWLPSLLYFGTNNQKMWTAQYVLRKILSDINSLYGSSAIDVPIIATKNAGIVVIVLPLIIMSPILHKYFSKGLVAGAVKG